ncbi:hypothetical protein PSTG_12390 [Puccinia striiformis f. sp. tritici PST-78]|uniref:Uncharacterized protein n=1 Tax=Puccinia striiformis f. sp. tritici PST-78 TaxID=1165861 RepID=A0A0L0V4P6_9BASI|nr:hypothetical protein PSTG_12390 [Puccinia striiformis f. sp. tritici PST-78]
MENSLLAAIAAAGASIMENASAVTSITISTTAINYLGSMWNTYDRYYGDGGQARYVRYLLNKVQPELFCEITRMERLTFDSLIQELRANLLLKEGRLVSVEEQVPIFLDITDFLDPRYFGLVLDALWSMYPNYVKFDEESCRQPEHLRNNPKYKAFKHALGALDGVFVSARVPVDAQSPWRNRKHVLAQNVLATVNFNFEFVFVLAGWEGSAHNTRVFNDATANGLNIPQKKQRPSNKQELYNLRHASLRNCVERIFGCLKRKFPILRSAPEVELRKQVRLVYVLCMLWNYMRCHETLENMMDDDENKTSQDNTGGFNQDRDFDVLQEDEQMKRRHDRLAGRLWTQYLEYCSRL